MYFILFLLFSVANSSSVVPNSPALEAACTYLESVGNWMLLDDKSIDILCLENNTNEREVANIIINGLRAHIKKIEAITGDLIPIHIGYSYRNSLSREEEDTMRTVHGLNIMWSKLNMEKQNRVYDYYEKIIKSSSSQTDTLEKALVYRMMRILPVSSRVVYGGFSEMLSLLADGYKKIIADPLYTQNRSSRVLIIHTIITLSNIYKNPDLKHEDYENINSLFNELKSLPTASSISKKKIDQKAVELLDVLDNVWKKLSGEVVFPFTIVEGEYKTEIRKTWDNLMNSLGDVWRISYVGVHPPCEKILKGHFGSSLKVDSPDINWLRALKSGEREKKFKEEGHMYYFLDSLLYPIRPNIYSMHANCYEN